MSFYLEVPNFTNRYVTIDCPAPTNASGYNYEIEFELKVTGTEFIVYTRAIATTDAIAFIKSTQIDFRSVGNANILMTHGATITNWNKYRLVFTGTGAGNIALYVNDVFKANFTPSSTIAGSSLAGLLTPTSSARTANFRYFKYTDNNNAASNRFYDARAHLAGETYIKNTSGSGANGIFNAEYLALPPVWVDEGGSVTPIAFANSIPDQTFTAGDSVSVNLATIAGPTGTETPFSYANTGTALTGTGLSISSAGVLTGTATEATSAAVVLTGTDSATNTANSNAFSVTVNAAPALAPQGTITVGTITKDHESASIPFSYDDTDQTGFKCSIDGDTPFTVTSPIALSGLTESTTYNYAIYAYNAVDDGTAATGSFTTDAAPVVDAVFTSEPLKDNTGTLLASEALDYVAIYDSATGDLVLRVTGLSTNASGVFSVQSSLLTSGVTYKADWKVTSQLSARMPAKAAV